jgi:chain length determinant protein EpsF
LSPALNLRQYLLIFRAHWMLALSLALGLIALGVPVLLLLPKQYTAVTSLALDIKSPDPITMLLMPSNLASQEDIIKSDRVTQKVIRSLALDDDPALRAQWQREREGRGSFQVWLAEQLHRRLAVHPARREGNVITIEFSAPDPRRAAAVANAFASTYVEAVVEMKVEPAKQYARVSSDQGKALRAELEAAQARLSAFQQKKGIGIRDEALEAEADKLAQLTTQLTVAQTEAAEARSKQRAGAAALPDSPAVQNLRGEIGRHEAKLREASANLGANHPQYRAMQAELEGLRARLDAETRHVASGFAASRSVGAGKERELKAAIDAQRRKLLGLRAERDELAVLQRDVEAAKNAYETAERRHTQTSLDSQATQTQVFVLRPAVEPVQPSFPKVVPYTLMLVVLGLLLGAGAAHLREMLDRRVRGVDDLAALLQIPVLSVIERDASRGALALRRRNAPLALPR